MIITKSIIVELYNLAYQELRDRGATEQEIDVHISFDDGNSPRDMKGVYLSMAENITNRRGMRNTIGDINNYKDLLFSFDPLKVLKKYSNASKLLDAISKANLIKSSINKTNKRSYPYIFAYGCFSIAKFLSKFTDYNDYNGFIKYFLETDDYRRLVGLPLILEKEIHGFKFALACDYLKENHSNKFIKPDVHIKEILDGIGMIDKNKTDYEIFFEIIEMCKIAEIDPYSFDKILWLIGSGNFYRNNKKIKTNKKEFINKAQVSLNHEN